MVVKKPCNCSLEAEVAPVIGDFSYLIVTVVGFAGILALLFFLCEILSRTQKTRNLKKLAQKKPPEKVGYPGLGNSHPIETVSQIVEEKRNVKLPNKSNADQPLENDVKQAKNFEYMEPTRPSRKPPEKEPEMVQALPVPQNKLPPTSWPTSPIEVELEKQILQQVVKTPSAPEFDAKSQTWSPLSGTPAHTRTIPAYPLSPSLVSHVRMPWKTTTTVTSVTSAKAYGNSKSMTPLPVPDTVTRQDESVVKFGAHATTNGFAKPILPAASSESTGISPPLSREEAVIRELIQQKSTPPKPKRTFNSVKLEKPFASDHSPEMVQVNVEPPVIDFSLRRISVRMKNRTPSEASGQSNSTASTPEPTTLKLPDPVNSSSRKSSLNSNDINEALLVVGRETPVQSNGLPETFAAGTSGDRAHTPQPNGESTHLRAQATQQTRNITTNSSSSPEPERVQPSAYRHGTGIMNGTSNLTTAKTHHVFDRNANIVRPDSALSNYEIYGNVGFNNIRTTRTEEVEEITRRGVMPQTFELVRNYYPERSDSKALAHNIMTGLFRGQRESQLLLQKIQSLEGKMDFLTLQLGKSRQEMPLMRVPQEVQTMSAYDLGYPAQKQRSTDYVDYEVCRGFQVPPPTVQSKTQLISLEAIPKSSGSSRDLPATAMISTPPLLSNLKVTETLNSSDQPNLRDVSPEFRNFSENQSKSVLGSNGSVSTQPTFQQTQEAEALRKQYERRLKETMTSVQEDYKMRLREDKDELWSLKLKREGELQQEVGALTSTIENQGNALSNLQWKLNTFEKNISQLATEKALLESCTQEVKSGWEAEKKAFAEEKMRLEELLLKMKSERQELLGNFQQLVGVKVTLDSELKKYKTLIENEDIRQSVAAGTVSQNTQNQPMTQVGTVPTAQKSITESVQVRTENRAVTPTPQPNIERSMSPAPEDAFREMSPAPEGSLRANSAVQLKRVELDNSENYASQELKIENRVPSPVKNELHPEVTCKNSENENGFEQGETRPMPPTPLGQYQRHDERQPSFLNCEDIRISPLRFERRPMSPLALYDGTRRVENQSKSAIPVPVKQSK